MDIELPGIDGPEAIANLSAFCRVHLELVLQVLELEAFVA